MTARRHVSWLVMHVVLVCILRVVIKLGTPHTCNMCLPSKNAVTIRCNDHRIKLSHCSTQQVRFYIIICMINLA